MLLSGFTGLLALTVAILLLHRYRPQGFLTLAATNGYLSHDEKQVDNLAGLYTTQHDKSLYGLTFEYITDNLYTTDTLFGVYQCVRATSGRYYTISCGLCYLPYLTHYKVYYKTNTTVYEKVVEIKDAITKVVFDNFNNNTVEHIMNFTGKLTNDTKSVINEYLNSTNFQQLTGLESLACTFTVVGAVSCNSEVQYCDGEHKVLAPLTIDTGSGLAVNRSWCRYQKFTTTHTLGPLVDKFERDGVEYDLKLPVKYLHYLGYFVADDYLIRYNKLETLNCTESLGSEFCSWFEHLVSQANDTSSCTVQHNTHRYSLRSTGAESKNKTQFVTLRSLQQIYREALSTYGLHLMIYNCLNVTKSVVYYNHRLVDDLLMQLPNLLRGLDTAKEVNQRLNLPDFITRHKNGKYQRLFFAEEYFIRGWFGFFILVIVLFTVLGVKALFSSYGYNVNFMSWTLFLVTMRLFTILFPWTYWPIKILCWLLQLFSMLLGYNERSIRRYSIVINCLIQATITAVNEEGYSLDLTSFGIAIVMATIGYAVNTLYQRSRIQFDCHVVHSWEYSNALKLNVSINNAATLLPLLQLLESCESNGKFLRKYNLENVNKFITMPLQITADSLKQKILLMEYVRFIADLYYSKNMGSKYFTPTVDAKITNMTVFLYDETSNDNIIKELISKSLEFTKPVSGKLESTANIEGHQYPDYCFDYVDRVMFVKYTGYQLGQSLDKSCDAFLWDSNTVYVERHLFIPGECCNEDEYLQVHKSLDTDLSGLSFKNGRNASLNVVSILPYEEGNHMFKFRIGDHHNFLGLRAPIISTSSGACTLLYLDSTPSMRRCLGISNGKGAHTCNTEKGYCGAPLVNSEGLLGFHIFTAAITKENKYVTKELLQNRGGNTNYYVRPDGFSFRKTEMYDIGEVVYQEFLLDIDLQLLTALVYLHNSTKKRKAIQFTIPSDTQWSVVRNFLENEDSICVDNVDSMIDRIIVIANKYGFSDITEKELRGIVYFIGTSLTSNKFQNVDFIQHYLTGDISLRLTPILDAFRGYISIEQVFYHSSLKLKRRSLESVGGIVKYSAADNMILSVVGTFLHEFKGGQDVNSNAYITLFDRYNKMLVNPEPANITPLFEDVVNFIDKVWPTYVISIIDDPNSKYAAIISQRVYMDGFREYLRRHKFTDFYQKPVEQIAFLRNTTEAKADVLFDKFVDLFTQHVNHLTTTGMLTQHLADDYLKTVLTSLEESQYLNKEYKTEVQKQIEAKIGTFINVFGCESSSTARTLFDEYLLLLEKYKDTRMLLDDCKDFDLETVESILDTLNGIEMDDVTAKMEIARLTKMFTKRLNTLKNDNEKRLASQRKIDQSDDYNADKIALHQQTRQQQNKRVIERALKRIVDAMLIVIRMNYSGLSNVDALNRLIDHYGSNYVYAILDGSIGTTYKVFEDKKNLYLTGYILTNRVHRVMHDNQPRWVFDSFFFTDNPEIRRDGDFYIFKEPVKVYRNEGEKVTLQLKDVSIAEGSINNDLEIVFGDKIYNVIVLDGENKRDAIKTRIQHPSFHNVMHTITVIERVVGKLESSGVYTYSQNGKMYLGCGHLLSCKSQSNNGRAHVHSDFACYYWLRQAYNDHIERADGLRCGGFGNRSWLHIVNNGVHHRCGKGFSKCSIRDTTRHQQCNFTCLTELFGYLCTECSYCDVCPIAIPRGKDSLCKNRMFHGMRCPINCDDTTCTYDHAPSLEAFDTSISSSTALNYQFIDPTWYHGQIPVLTKSDTIPMNKSGVEWVLRPGCTNIYYNARGQSPKIFDTLVTTYNTGNAKANAKAKTEARQGAKAQPLCEECGKEVYNPLQHFIDTQHSAFTYQSKRYSGVALALLTMELGVSKSEVYRLLEENEEMFTGMFDFVKRLNRKRSENDSAAGLH